ncbi:hypothetical protein ACFRCI_39080 [Streptomyces sp. NPDC056638]
MASRVEQARQTRSVPAPYGVDEGVEAVGGTFGDEALNAGGSPG